MNGKPDRVDPTVETLLNDFVFRDCRLGEHPKVRARLCWLEGDVLVTRETAPPNVDLAGVRTPLNHSVSGYALRTNAVTVVANIEAAVRFAPPFLQSIRSLLTVPLSGGPEILGVLNLDSTDGNFFSEADIGRSQLLGALLVYSRFRHLRVSSPVTASLGLALKRVRGELGPHLLGVLQDDPEQLRRLSPSQFERFVANRLDRMGYDVTLSGSTSQRDGGIDLIAIPKVRTVGSFLIAGQVKHHRGEQKVPRGDVDRLLAWKDSPFRLALLVTNTTYTGDARWVADQMANRSFLRLRDFDDLKRWIEDNFDSEKDWREIQDCITLAPGIVVKVPRSRLETSGSIWRLSGVTKLKKWPQGHDR